MFFLVVFRVASKNVNYELSSCKLSLAALFFLHLWVQICLLRKILALCFNISHLRSTNLHLTMQFQYLQVLICVQMHIVQMFLKSRNTNFECKICTFKTHFASHKCGMYRGNVRELAYGDPHLRYESDTLASATLLCACLSFRLAHLSF